MLMISLTPTYPRILPDRDAVFNWYIDEPFMIKIVQDDKTLIIECPKGYRVDAHSVPFLAKLIFPKVKGLDFYCSVVHDILINEESLLRINRKFQDNIYDEMMWMPEYKTSNFRSMYMPLAVKLSGYLRYTIWGDNRGEPKDYTKLTLTLVEHDKDNTI